MNSVPSTVPRLDKAGNLQDDLIPRSQITVKVSQLPGILLEKYIYTAGTVEPLPKHSHQEYQLGMSFNCQGEQYPALNGRGLRSLRKYYYRGAYHPIPIGSLSIIHSGEMPSPIYNQNLKIGEAQKLLS